MPQNEPKKRKTWEGFAALVCAVFVWVVAEIMPALTSSPAFRPQPIFPTVAYIIGTAFAIGFAVSGLRCGGGRNRFWATLALLMVATYLVPNTVVEFRRFLRNRCQAAKDDRFYAYGGEMIYAASNGPDSERVKMLLKANPALVNQTNSVGMTALHYAAFGGSKELAEILLSAKADVNACDMDGLTPLHWAASCGSLGGSNHAEVARILLSHGAKVNALDKQGRTPLTWTTYYKSNEVVEVLLENGAKK